MASSGYTAITFVADQLLTSTVMNQMAANDAAFNNGNGFEDSIILTRHLNALNVTKAKIAAAVTDMLDYSTSEKATGFTWVDGKVIYKKTINFGTLPNTTSKSVSHGLAGGYNHIIKHEGFTQVSVGSSWGPIPSVDTATTRYFKLEITANDIVITTTSDRTVFTITYITLYYTKP